MSLQNPMGLNSAPSNYVQPNSAAPAASPAVASYPVGFDTLLAPDPIPAYNQPGTEAPSNDATVGPTD